MTQKKIHNAVTATEHTYIGKNGISTQFSVAGYSWWYQCQPIVGTIQNCLGTANHQRIPVWQRWRDLLLCLQPGWHIITGEWRWLRSLRVRCTVGNARIPSRLHAIVRHRCNLVDTCDYRFHPNATNARRSCRHHKLARRVLSIKSNYIYTVSKKIEIWNLAIPLSNLNQFAHFFTIRTKWYL